MIYRNMKIYTKEDVKQMEGLDRPEPLLTRFPASASSFLKSTFRHTLCSQPIRWSLQVVALLIFIVWGFVTHHWTPFLIFAVLTIVLRGAMLYGYKRIHRTYREGNCYYRIDKYGISLIVRHPDGDFIRNLTDAWTLVRSVWVYRDFIAIKMEKKAEGANEYFLFADDVDQLRAAVLGYWQLALEGLSPDEDIPDFYTEEEQQEVLDFIEEHMGTIECIGYEKESTDMHIDLAIIAPTDERPYYTVCTVGAGAVRYNYSLEARTEYAIPEYSEYVIYLPADWNIMGEGYAEEKNWWPLRLLKNSALYATDPDITLFANRSLNFYKDEEDTFDPSTTACAAYFDYPLPDPAHPLKVHLSTGCTVSFLQVIPINREEINYHGRDVSYEDCYYRFFHIDLDAIEEASSEERARLFREQLLAHFHSLLRPSSC